MTPRKPAKKVASSGRPRLSGVPPESDHWGSDNPVVASRAQEADILRAGHHLVSDRTTKAELQRRLWVQAEEIRRLRGSERNLKQQLEEEPEEDDRELEAEITELHTRMGSAQRTIDGLVANAAALCDEAVRRDKTIADLFRHGEVEAERANKAEHHLQVVLDLAGFYIRKGM
jgi:chromosome segregation ATPase